MAPVFGCAGKSAGRRGRIPREKPTPTFGWRTDEDSERNRHGCTSWLRGLPDRREVFSGACSGSSCGRGLSGHPSSTLGFEKGYNRALRFTDQAEFVKRMLAEIPPRPSGAETIRATNLGRAVASFDDAP